MLFLLFKKHRYHLCFFFFFMLRKVSYLICTISCLSIRNISFFFFDSRKPHLLESTLCRPRWASKTPAVPGSYKRCTLWLELETCCADLKPFAITLCPLGTFETSLVVAKAIHSNKSSYKRCISDMKLYLKRLVGERPLSLSH
jgi:hypothetical protein